MRVLHLLDTTEDYAGTEIHLTTLVRAQIEQGIGAEIACAEGGLLHRAVQEQGLPHSLLPSGNFPQKMKELGRATRHKYDVVHAHNGRTRLLAALAVKPPIAVVATQHFISTQSETYRGLKKWAANRAHRQVNRRIAHYLAISGAVREAMMAREGITSSKITVVPNGIDPLRAPDAAQKIEIRRELGIAEEAPFIFCAARLRAEKGLDFLIAAMPQIVSAHPQTRLFIAGDGDLESELKAQVKELNLSNSIQLLGYRSDATRLMGAADLFVLPSPAEPFGLVIIEAMAQGVATIATRAGGPLEIIEDGLSGQLVKPADAPDLAAAIIELLFDSARRAALGERALGRFNAHFTAERMAAATVEVYRSATRR